MEGLSMKASPEQGSLSKNEQQNHDARLAMRISLIVGVLMLAGKMTAYLLTGSAAIFSDAAESVVHVVAVAFAVFSLWLSIRPAVAQFQYGYERIAFFSAGFEGAMIVLAAGSIVVTAIHKWRHGLVLDNLGHRCWFATCDDDRMETFRSTCRLRHSGKHSVVWRTADLAIFEGTT
jgi:divalent metal cation (Fe/Co/Zn/Cd) transporter